MELFETKQHYIVLEGENSLWCNRENGKLTTEKGFDIASIGNHICLGLVNGVIGKVRITAESEKLLLISQISYIGNLSEKHHVYGINKIAVLPISKKETPELGLELCKKHHFGIKKTGKMTVSPENQPIGLPLQKTWNTIKTATAQVKGKKIFAYRRTPRIGTGSTSALRTNWLKCLWIQSPFIILQRAI